MPNGMVSVLYRLQVEVVEEGRGDETEEATLLIGSPPHLKSRHARDWIVAQHRDSRACESDAVQACTLARLTITA